MKSGAFSRAFVSPSMSGVSGLLAFQTQHQRTFKFLEQHDRLMSSLSQSPLKKMLDQIDRLSKPSYMSSTALQAQMKWLSLENQSIASRALLGSRLTTLPSTVMAAYGGSLASTSGVARVMMQLPFLSAVAGLHTPTLDRVFGLSKLTSRPAPSRMWERWLRDTPMVYAVQRWEVQLAQVDLDPEAPLDEVSLAATDAGVVTLGALVAEVHRALDEHRQTEHGLNERLSASERQQKAWLLKPEFLIGTLLALFSMINNPDVLGFYASLSVTTVAHVKQIVREWGEVQKGAQADLYVVKGRAAILHVRPHGPSRVTRRVVPGQTVMVKARRGKWVQVSVYDPQRDQLVTGWCLKKYLRRVK